MKKILTILAVMVGLVLIPTRVVQAADEGGGSIGTEMTDHTYITLEDKSKDTGNDGNHGSNNGGTGIGSLPQTGALAAAGISFLGILLLALILYLIYKRQKRRGETQ